MTNQITAPLKIAIVDDHKLFAEALKNVLPLYNDTKEVNTFINGEGLLTHLESAEVDLVLLDLGIKEGMNGFDTLTELQRRRPDVKVIVISMHTQNEYVNRVRRLGGSGYLPKDTSSETLREAIHAVMRSDTFYTTLKQYSDNPFNSLSKSEIKVAMHLLSGKSNAQIAEEIFRSKETIDTHRKNIYRKLEVNSVVDFVKLGVKHGMLTDAIQ